METKAPIRPQISGFQQLREVFSQPNPRKRAYPYESTTSLATAHGNNEVLQEDCYQSKQVDSNSPPKRNRTTEWPLKNVIDPRDNSQAPPIVRGKGTSSRKISGKRNITNRPSRFHEGSLNDRPSKQPPAAFTGADDGMEQYHKYVATEEKGSTMDDAGIEGARPISTFKFGKLGKVVANVFSGFWKEKEPPEPPLKGPVFDDRKAKAEDAYAILKSQGFKGTQSCLAQPDSQNSSSSTPIGGPPTNAKSFRDSGIDIDESQRFSLQSIRTGNASGGLKPPSDAASKRSVSPISGILPGRRSASLHLRTPSLQSLKNIKSQIQVPSISRPADKPPPPPISGSEDIEPHTANGLRRQLSKKDLARYQKLSKKVSDLESKLDIARRDLEKSLKDAPPVPDVPNHTARRPFTPGTLASLPSERLLISQSANSPIAQNNKEILGSATVSSAPGLLSSPSRQLDHELNNSLDIYAAERDKKMDACMSSDPIARPDIDGIDHASWSAAQAAKNRRKASRRVSEQQPSIEGRNPAGIQKRRSTTVPKPPKNSPIQMDETAPPTPAISITADQVDKPRPDSPFLGRPGAVSPVRTRSKNHKRQTSPPPSDRASALKKRKARSTTHNDGKDTSLTPDRAAGNRQKLSVAKGSPAPKAIQLRAARAKAIRVTSDKQREKPVPEIQAQREDFNWDEDVF